jgi:acyl-CoA dehydrogenase
MYVEQAAVDIRALPKLEGTVHVNIALIVKFMPNYFFAPADLPHVPRRDEAVNDDFLFDQGPAKGLGNIRFHDYRLAFDSYDLPNISLFKEQIAVFCDLLSTAPPTESQMKDIDFLLAGGELFTLVVYAQLILENARIYSIDKGLIDQIFDFLVRDFSRFALQLYSKPTSTKEQMTLCMKMIRRPLLDETRYGAVWNDHVLALKGAYEMNR